MRTAMKIALITMITIATFTLAKGSFLGKQSKQAKGIFDGGY